MSDIYNAKPFNFKSYQIAFGKVFRKFFDTNVCELPAPYFMQSVFHRVIRERLNSDIKISNIADLQNHLFEKSLEADYNNQVAPNSHSDFFNCIIRHNLDLEISNIPFDETLSAYTCMKLIKGKYHHKNEYCHSIISASLMPFLVSDRFIVLESDFSKPRPISVKYLIRPLLKRPIRHIFEKENNRLFISDADQEAAENNNFFGVRNAIEEIFGGQVGDNSFGFLKSTGASLYEGEVVGFLSYAKGSYVCIYVFPILTKDGEKELGRMQNYFSNVVESVANFSNDKIHRNSHRSRMRHTIGVQIERLNENYDVIEKNRGQILSAFKGKKKNKINQIIGRITESIELINQDAALQFVDEFDGSGQKIVSKDTLMVLSDITTLELVNLIKNCVEKNGKSNTRLVIYNELEGQSIKAPYSVLREAFVEIVLNASKYTIGKKVIELRVYKDNGDTIIEIGNLSEKIDDDEIRKIPTFGLRALSIVKGTAPGTGRGLANIEQVLQQYNIDFEASQKLPTENQLKRLTKQQQMSDIAFFFVTITI